jgi:hypothetical protein
MRIRPIRRAPNSLNECRRGIVRCQDVQRLTVPTVNVSELCSADANGPFQHGLGEVGCAFGEVGCSLAQFVEQPRVLDGDDGLSSEVLDKFDLLISRYDAPQPTGVAMNRRVQDPRGKRSIPVRLTNRYEQSKHLRKPMRFVHS